MIITTVPTGDIGFDVLLGGGWQLVPRLPEKESCTILLRGGPGAGKTLVGLQAALALAQQLKGDVAVACVELLPSEYAAQCQSARKDIAPGDVVQLPGGARAGSSGAPGIFIGLLPDSDPASVDLVGGLEVLREQVIQAGGKPVVFVVDSLIEGYGLGSSAPRLQADAVMKFAVSRGCGLVLCEETLSAEPSAWSFAADTVLELGVASDLGRWIEVRKHRFAACATGRHALSLRGGLAPEAVPEIHAWRARRLWDVLRKWGWEVSNQAPADERESNLVLKGALKPRGGSGRLRGSFALVRCEERRVAMRVAFGLVPNQGEAHRFVVALDGLARVASHNAPGDAGEDAVLHLPVCHGPQWALRTLVQEFGHAFRGARAKGRPINRVVLGDLALVFTGENGMAWANALLAFAGLLLEAGMEAPLICFESRDQLARSPAAVFVQTAADALILVEWRKDQKAYDVAVTQGGVSDLGSSWTWDRGLEQTAIENEDRLLGPWFSRTHT